jgi:hypothetical protein
MTFSKISVKGGVRFLSTDAEVDAAQKQLEVVFPDGYREYVTTFGEGTLGGSYIRIFPPHALLAWRKHYLELMRDYWLWDEEPFIFTQKQALESYAIGDTLDGDQLVVHPDNKDKIFVLPRNEYRVYEAGVTLAAAIEWLCTAGILTEVFDERELEPFNSR